MTAAMVFRMSAVTIAAAVLASCAGQSSPWYDPPPGLTSATGATVSMSQNPATPGGPDGDTRVVTIDDKPVNALNFDKIVLPPGNHTLGVEYNGTAASATVSIEGTLRAGTSYSAKGEKNGPCDARIWLQDQTTNEVLGSKLDTHLMAKATNNGAPVFAVACD